MNNNEKYTGLEIAVIGISCRFPGAPDWKTFWNNLITDKESIKFYSDDELANLKTDVNIINHKNYVKAASTLEDKEYFDSSFFDYRPDEAQLMNPQHRLFHECVWEALEDSGYNPDKINKRIGLYAGAGDDINWKIYSLIKNKDELVDNFSLSQLNNKDYLASLVSYKLNLTGSAYSLQTACSTSLVAVHQACRSLLHGEVGLAIAGGASISTRKDYGYIYQEGKVFSKDGHCRAFDKDATGTVGGEGVGVVVLKRLNEAIQDNDSIYAVIKGSAINNDGNRKVGFTAPSIQGQVDCIRMAHTFANVRPSSISYVEMHGTGTKLGDPIEVEALNTAFGNNTKYKCAIGSVKTNIGHLDAAAGIAGLIKTVLCLKYKKIPASLNYKEPNPNINFSNGPFYVNTKLKDWETDNSQVLRAGVNSFGIGGTNAHVILEEFIQLDDTEIKVEPRIITLSAKSRTSLLNNLKNIRNYLLENNNINLDSLCYTLNTGRKHFAQRCSFAFDNLEDLLRIINEKILLFNTEKIQGKHRSVVFMFSGAGSQYVNMGKDLYQKNSFFRNEMNGGFELAKKWTGEDYKNIIYPQNEKNDTIHLMRYTQPVLFIFGHSLAKLVNHLGISQSYMIGHSVGEYVAACLSGVFTFEDALKLVIRRGILMDEMPFGSMVSASITESEAMTYINDEISLAAVNAPNQVVFSGSKNAIDNLKNEFEEKNILYVKLNASHAGHSHMIDNILTEYSKELGKFSLCKPKVPFISNVTGNFISNAEATSSEYWVKHMRKTVQFSKGINTLINNDSNCFFIELGSGHSLTSLLLQNTNHNTSPVNLIRHFKEKIDDFSYFFGKVSQVWSSGIDINWDRMYAQKCRKISLPTYSFDKIKYLAEIDAYELLKREDINLTRNIDSKRLTGNLYRPQWKKGFNLIDKEKYTGNETALVFYRDCVAQNSVNIYIRDKGLNCIYIEIGDSFKIINDSLLSINPSNSEDYNSLFNVIADHKYIIVEIIYLWSFDDFKDDNELNIEDITSYINNLYRPLLYIVRSFRMNKAVKTIKFTLITNNLYNLNESDKINPIKSVVLGALKSIQVEFANIQCKAIDVYCLNNSNVESILLQELNQIDNGHNIEVALRGSNRYIKYFECLSNIEYDFPVVFKDNSTYLIIGGTGGLGKIVCEHLVENYNANLIIIGRSIEPSNIIANLRREFNCVTYIQSDISDYDYISKEIELFEKNNYPINGVINASGVTDSGGVILKRAWEDDVKVFTTKIYGTMSIYKIFKCKKLDFFVNFSALAASIPSFGQSAYVIANNFQSAFADKYCCNFPIISIEWCAIQGVGMLKNINDNKRTIKLNRHYVVEVLQYALNLKLPVISVSTLNLDDAIQENYQIFKNIKTLEQDHFDISLMSDESSTYRPILNPDVEAPTSEVEIELVEIWKNFFGYNEIGINDSFFELGGDSLKALVVSKRIEKKFNVIITLVDFFSTPTIKELAKIISKLPNDTDNYENSMII